MPRRFTLGDLRTMAQERCDKVNESDLDSTAWNRMISTSWAELYAVVASTGLRYFETVEVIATDGSASYQEPTDHMATVGVDRIVDSSGHRRPLRELMVQERARLAGLSGDAVGWALVDDQLYLYPKPPAGQNYEWLYVPQPPQLTAQDDSFIVDVVTPDGESMVIWGVAVQVLAREESDTIVARQEREAARERVFEWATLRNLNSSRRIISDRDVYDGSIDPADYGFNQGWRD